MIIKGREISENHPPFIVAEMSSNHQQSLDRALKMVDAAANAGAHAMKLQTATPEGLTMDSDSPDFLISDKHSLWHGRRLYELYQQAVTPWEWHKAIFDRCQHHNLICFSSPFERKAVNFLETLDVPCYKMASFELVDVPLIKSVAATGKPIILSTGMATLSEIETAVNAIHQMGNHSLALLKCTSTYPALPTDTHLNTIPHLKNTFRVEVGLSDHTMGIGVACAAVALGATIIEKHFTLDRSSGGLDAEFSIEPSELKQLVIETEKAWQARGTICYGGSINENKSVQFRRSIYIIEDIHEGEILTDLNVSVIRPGYGLSPNFIEYIIGKKVNRDLKKGTAMSWDYI